MTRLRILVIVLFVIVYASCTVGSDETGDATTTTAGSSTDIAVTETEQSTEEGTIREKIWECDENIPIGKYTEADSVLPTLQLALYGTSSPKPVVYEAFVEYELRGEVFRICVISDLGPMTRMFRGDRILKAGVRKLSSYGVIGMEVIVDGEKLYSVEMTESMDIQMYSVE